MTDEWWQGYIIGMVVSMFASGFTKTTEPEIAKPQERWISRPTHSGFWWIKWGHDQKVEQTEVVIPEPDCAWFYVTANEQSFTFTEYPSAEWQEIAPAIS